MLDGLGGELTLRLETAVNQSGRRTLRQTVGWREPGDAFERVVFERLEISGQSPEVLLSADLAMAGSPLAAWSRDLLDRLSAWGSRVAPALLATVPDEDAPASLQADLLLSVAGGRVRGAGSELWLFADGEPVVQLVHWHRGPVGFRQTGDLPFAGELEAIAATVAEWAGRAETIHD